MKVFIVDADEFKGSLLQYEQKMYAKTNVFLEKNYTRCLIPMVATSKKCTFNDICMLLSDKSECSNNIREQLFYNLYAIYCSVITSDSIGLKIARNKIRPSKPGKKIESIVVKNEFKQCAAAIGLDAKSLSELLLTVDLGFIMTKSAHGTGDFFSLITKEAIIPDDVMYAYIFQLYYTLYVFSSSGMNHNDLHLGNILMDARMSSETPIAGFVLPSNNQILFVNTPQVPRVFDYDRSTTEDMPNKLEDWLQEYGQTNEFYPLKDFLKVSCQIIEILGNRYPDLAKVLSDDIEQYPGKLMRFKNATGDCFYMHSNGKDGSYLNDQPIMSQLLYSPEKMLENMANRLSGQVSVANFVGQSTNKHILRDNIFAGPKISTDTKNKLFSQLKI